MVRSHRAGRLTRRDFLAGATALGLAAPLARSLAGAPARAAEPAPVPGGRLRISMSVMAIADPRLFDWPEKGNLARGTLETLVRYDADAALVPWLLEGWEVNADASEFLLRLRPEVYWTNGDAFAAEDVIANLSRWAEAHVPGNSMAARIASLTETKRVETRRILTTRAGREIEDEIEVAVTGLIEGAVERVDALTVRLRPVRPDITLIPGFSDYPALIVHRDFDAAGGDLIRAPIGTGPWVLDRVDVGVSAALSRRADTNGWWGARIFGPAPLDGIDYVDHGTDPERDLAAFEAGEIDANYETTPAYVPDFDAAGLNRADARTANTVCVRMNVEKPPFTVQITRNAVQRAVDNAVVLELGQQDRGIVAENHHVAPMHPDYAAIPPIPADPARARAMLREAGAAETEFELVSSDADVPRNTCDAVAAQMRDAGMRVRRVILPGAAFWRDWRGYPFSATEWIGRPLAAQTYALAYRSDAPWNETGFADPEFDALLDRALALADPEARRPLMAEMETRLRDSGVLVQAFWRDTFRHMTGRVRGLAMHPTFELHLEQVWLAPGEDPER
ncbi:ABC transporter substrate-binding protein [Amaricoccus solimangrovi]|uniref:Diguanylate cyclase n=1 Tax=Amaricoccus solimangrovi TaxID=2589815 RepID=A0A501WY12_9RHOB|nr:ABC transporter substrate-binding protein [Amaricoccus solimangrovi]TPE53145.1 diguanylate cyclase [Amaricoccus solimangrovi]